MVHYQYGSSLDIYQTTIVLSPNSAILFRGLQYSVYVLMCWGFVCCIPCAHVHCAIAKGSIGQICICYGIYNIHSIVQHNCIKHWAVDKYACLCSGALSKAKARDKSELGRCIWAKANRESNCCVFHHSLLHSEPQLNVIVSEQNLFVQSQFWNSFLVRLCGN